MKRNSYLIPILFLIVTVIVQTFTSCSNEEYEENTVNTATKKAEILALGEKYGIDVKIENEERIAKIDLNLFEEYLSKLQSINLNTEQTLHTETISLSTNLPDYISRESIETSPKASYTKSLNILYSKSISTTLKELDPTNFSNYDPLVGISGFYSLTYDTSTSRYIHNYRIAFVPISGAPFPSWVELGFQCKVRHEFIGIHENSNTRFTSVDRVIAEHYVSGGWNATIIGKIEATFTYLAPQTGSVTLRWIPEQISIVD